MPMNDSPLSDESKSFVILAFGEPNPSREYFDSLPNEFLHGYQYLYTDIDNEEYWSAKKGWLDPTRFDKELLYKELYEFLQKRT